MAITTNSMRIAIVVTRADSIGGAQVHVLDLATALLSAGHEAIVMAGGDGPLTVELNKRRIPHVSIPHLIKPLNPLSDLRAACELRRAFRALCPHLVAAHTAKAGMLARWAARLAGVPAVFTPHGWAISDRISNRQGRVFRILEKVGAHFSARIINVCEYERDLALRYKVAPSSKLSVVHNGIPDVPASLFARPYCDPPRLITIARFEEPKDHRTLLCALAKLQDYAWTIDLIGDGPLQPAMQRLAADLGISDRVHFLGPRRDVASLLAEAQLFVLSTRSEAFPYTVLEAMRAGLPVVSSDAGGIREAVTDTQTGLLAPVKDVMSLAARLQTLIVNPGLRTAMGNAGRQRFLQHFTHEKMMARTIEIYREVISENRVNIPGADFSPGSRHVEMAEYGSK